MDISWRPINEVLGAGLSLKQYAMLRLALSFFTWRTRLSESGLNQADAVEAMVQAIGNATEG